MKTLLVVIAAVLIACFVTLVVLVPEADRRASEQVADSAAEISSTTAEFGAHESFLYGRVITVDGETYEGRLRWGGDEEAFWGDYFNGSKAENPWASHVSPDQLEERHTIEVFGIEVAQRSHQIALDRPFMARFGDIARIEARERDIRVTLNSGTVFDLDRFSADDFADGVRVWDAQHGLVDLEELQIRTVRLLSATRSGIAPDRLHGTVRTRQGDFTGFVQWNRQECLGTDELEGRTSDGDVSLRFDTVGSIARQSSDSSLVTLLDGSEVVLFGTREAGDGHRGIYVDDRRYGRVLVSWDAFERVDFSSSAGASGPAYDDFPPGGPLTGKVTTRDGSGLVGRLVYDLDESEITETLDAPSRGVDYTIPFGLIASIALDSEERSSQPARVILQSGEELRLERRGDLGEGNTGMLIFVDGRKRPEYVPWRDVEQVDFDRPPAMYPPLDGT